MATLSSFSDPFFRSLDKSKVPHVFLTADRDDFDEDAIAQWQEEGFAVHYIPLLSGGVDFNKRLQVVSDSLGVGEQYAVVGN